MTIEKHPRARARALAALGAVVAAFGCSPARPPIAPPPTHAIAWPTTRGAEVQYQVHAGPDAAELWVQLVAPAAATRLEVPSRMRSFVRDAAVQRGAAWVPLPASNAFVCDAPPCTLRYRYLLADAARRFDDKDVALEDDAAIYAPASTWLLRTDGAPAGARYRLHVATPPGLSFVSGLFRAKDADAYEGLVDRLGEAPYGGFGHFDVRSFDVPGATLDVAFAPGDTGVGKDRLTSWIATQARAVAAYYGSYPVPRALVVVRAGGRGRIGSGSTMGEGGASIMLDVGSRTSEADLAEDWILVHEMVHVAFPSVLRPWAEEGLATYVEPIIRARAGLLDRDQVWRDLILGLPKGQPGDDDRGLDRTPSWGRTYWGGAGFWFLADVEIRRRTENRRSLDDALRAIVKKGGNVAVTWKLEDTFAIGDEATGVTVLRDLHRSMGEAPVRIDLAAEFRRLGVTLHRDRIEYDDAAPLASLRRAITGG